jgi:hypothetical protein
MTECTNLPDCSCQVCISRRARLAPGEVQDRVTDVFIDTLCDNTTSEDLEIEDIRIKGEVA